MQKTLLATLGALVLVASTPSLSPAPIFIKYEGVEGEAIAPGFEDYLPVQSLEWVRPCPAYTVVVVDPADPAACQCAPGCKPPEVIVRKAPGPSSPRLLRLHGATLDTEGLNPPLPRRSAEIVQQISPQSGDTHVLMMWELENVRVTSYSYSVTGNDVAMEELGLTFGAVRQTFFPPDGSPPVSEGFILEAGSQVPPLPTSGMVVLGEPDTSRQPDAAEPAKPAEEQAPAEPAPEAK